MGAMGVGRIANVERSLVLPGKGVPRQVAVPNRRQFLKTTGLVLAAGGLVACGGSDYSNDDPDWSYILETAGVAVADIVGVYFWGMPVGTLVSGVAKTIDAGNSDNRTPGSVIIEHPAHPMTQGTGTVLYDIPRNSNKKGSSTVDTQGKAWVHQTNPYPDDIESVTLVTSDGEVIMPKNQGQSSYVAGLWHPDADLFIVGVPELDYRKINFQTKDKQTGSIDI